MATKKNTAAKKAAKKVIDDIEVLIDCNTPMTARTFYSNEAGNRYSPFILDWQAANRFLKSGVPIKRLAWMGYWQMEDGKLVMHCKDGSLVTLADCDNAFTLDNIGAKDWMPLTQSMKDSFDAIHAAKILVYKKED